MWIEWDTKPRSLQRHKSISRAIESKMGIGPISSFVEVDEKHILYMMQKTNT